MPDWVTHILIGLIICELFDIKKKSLVIIGSILPDAVFKLSLLGLFFNIPEAEMRWVLMPLHNPIGLILLTIILVHVFKYDKIKMFLLVSIGWILHLILDLTNRDVYINQELLLFPFSWKTFEMNIFWPNEYYYILIPAVVIYLAIILIKNKTNLKQTLFS